MENRSAAYVQWTEHATTDEDPYSMDQNSTNSGNVTDEAYYYYNDTDYLYYDDDYLYYDEEVPYLLKVYPFELTALGIVRPILVMLTVIANVFVVVYFMTKKKRRNATNLLFVAIAFSDSMTGILLLPNSFHVYAEKNDELSRDWCKTYMVLRLYFSRVFHTVSVWQTLFLGAQRYVCVCHPFLSSRICTIGKTILAIAAAYIMSFVLHLYHLLDRKITEQPPRCEWMQEIPCTGMCAYLWICVVAQHMLPCLGLTLLTTKTLRGLQVATRRLSSMSKSSADRRSSRDRNITITSIAIVVGFLVPELPHGFYKLVLTISAHGQSDVGIHRSTEANHIIICIYELALLVSFHANFWIYCFMMQEFRKAVFRVATCEALRGGDKRHTWDRVSTSSRKNSAVSPTPTRRCSSVNSRKRLLTTQTSVMSDLSDNTACGSPVSPTSTELQHITNDDVFV